MSRSLSPNWLAHAACRGLDPEEFFPVGSGAAAQAQERHVKVICFGCPVRVACGQWAIDNREPIGVWGGMSESERRTILRRRGVRIKDVGPDDEAAA